MRDEPNDFAFTLQVTFPGEVLEAIKAAGALSKKHISMRAQMCSETVLTTVLKWIPRSARALPAD